MLSVEEFFSFSYMLVSSVSLLHQLRGHSLVTVVSRDSAAWIFCLEDRQEQRGLVNTRYVLNDVATRCNRQGASGVFQFVVFLLTTLELLIFCVAIYVHRLTIKRRIVVVGERLLCQLTAALVTITGVLMTALLVLPLAQYYVLTNTAEHDGSALGGFFDKIFRSPKRVFFSLLIFLVTAPLQSVLDGQYIIELDLDEIHANFTCVEPIVDRVTNAYKCPAELARGGLGHLPAPSACKESFDCVNDCEVVFPVIVMSSLCVILASFALCYRILNLRHNTTLTLQGVESTVLKGKADAATDLQEARCSTVANRRDGPKSTPSNAWNCSTTNDKVAAGRSTKPAAAGSSDCERQSSVEHRLRHTRQLIEGRESERNAEVDISEQYNGHDRASPSRDFSRRHEDVKGWRGDGLKNGERALLRLSENGRVKKRGKGGSVFRDETLERVEELEGCSSSGGEGDAVFTVVEDETDYYIAGFRL